LTSGKFRGNTTFPFAPKVEHFSYGQNRNIL